MLVPEEEEDIVLSSILPFKDLAVKKPILHLFKAVNVVSLQSYKPDSLSHALLKISNISWDTTTSDIVGMLEGFPVHMDHVHIPIDRATGKTKADMYVEMPDIEHCIKAISFYNRKIVKCRSLILNMASFEELYYVLFPIRYQAEEPIFGFALSPSEVLSLLDICRNYKVPSTSTAILTCLLRFIFPVSVPKGRSSTC